jgi:lycopene cyclase domain-containing protein
MQMEKYSYLITLLVAVLFPIAYSFDKRVRFYTKWKPLFIATIIPATFFIVWDIYFAKQGIWSFNDHYILGFRLMGLPLEEWLFFIVIPYCSIFVYEVIKSYFSTLDYNEILFWLLILLVFVFQTVALIHFHRNYTFWNFTFNAVFLVFLLLNSWFLKQLTYLVVTFVICLIPMMVVNGILTGLPIVEYDNSQIIGIKTFSIPFEDFFYYFLLLMMNLLLYERQLRSKKIK